MRPTMTALSLLFSMTLGVSLGAAEDDQVEIQALRTRATELELRLVQMEAHLEAERARYEKRIAAIELERMNEAVQLKRELEQLADAHKARDAKVVVEAIELRSLNADEAADMLNELLGSGANVAVDERRNTILLRGSEDVQELAKSIIENLDDAAEQTVESASLNITVDFIQASSGPSAGDSSLPDHLDGVGTALSEYGLGGARQMSTMMIRVGQGESFELNGFVDYQPVPEHELDMDRLKNLDIRVEGRVELTRDLVAAQITMGGEIIGSYPRGAQEVVLRADVTTRVPVGDYVVIGVMPSRLESGNTIAMVVRVVTDQ